MCHELGLEVAVEDGVGLLGVADIKYHPVISKIGQTDSRDGTEVDASFAGSGDLLVDELRDNDVDGLVGENEEARASDTGSTQTRDEQFDTAAERHSLACTHTEA